MLARQRALLLGCKLLPATASVAGCRSCWPQAVASALLSTTATTAHYGPATPLSATSRPQTPLHYGLAALRSNFGVIAPFQHHGRGMASSTLKSARVELRKRFGQHLLRNPDVVRAIIDAADIQPDETVFEIGPGSGNMTIHLLEKAKAVFAVELDTRLAEVVTRRANDLGYGGKFFLTNADFLAVPLPAFDKLVANIPYQISSPVMSRLFTHTPPPKAALIMFQLEFAQRIVAQPGTKDYSRLSVNSQLLSHSVRMVMKIGREQFNPPPKVDSAVVEIVPKGIPEDLDFPRWDFFLRVAFAGKNKRLRSVLVNKHVLAQMAGASASAASSSASSLPSSSATAAAAAEAVKSAFTTSAPSHPGLEDDDDDDIVDIEADGDDSNAGGDGSDVVKTSAGSFPRKELLDVRARIDAVIASITGAGEWRANGMQVKQFRQVFHALEAAGLKFPVINQRVYPTSAVAAAAPTATSGDAGSSGTTGLTAAAFAE